MRFNMAGRAAVLAIGLVFGCAARAQTVDIWPGVAPGSENWHYIEKEIPKGPFGPMIVNVVKPTLTAYLPERDNATGTGIIIAPGGAFVGLAIDQEGRDVARWLQARGIAAFVLKYRLMEKRASGMPTLQEMDAASKYAAADGIQSIKVLRQHAAEWGVASDKVGFIGFSAGATVAAGTLLGEDAAARPNFAGIIYGGPFGGPKALPGQLPPVFLAWAGDDPIGNNTAAKLYEALQAAGQKPEAHIFAAGGHGFGAKKQGLTSDHWIDEFGFWLEAKGFTKTAAGHAG
jgi:acetyl esterase/lipase